MPVSVVHLRVMFLTSVRIGAILLWASLVGGLIGLIVRDRVALVGLLMYVPLVPLGIVAILWDGAARGRAVQKLRFVLGATGALAIGCGVWSMTGPFVSGARAVANGAPLTVLQWNVRWGGGGGGEDGKLERWDLICRDIARHAPDIVILSECPRHQRLDHLLHALGPDWTSVRSEHTDPARYYYRLVVASRWPVTMDTERAIPSGRVMQAVVAAPGGEVRILVADGESHFLHDRAARLRAIAKICRDAAVSGRPIDVIAGDFNAVGRSIGFDAIETEGFLSAGATVAGWRGTWPSILPLYDIDHIWVSDRWSIVDFDRFTNLVTDHRGQVAHIDQRSNVR